MAAQGAADTQVQEPRWCGCAAIHYITACCRHELQHFVDVMQGYITNQLFYLSWGELEEDLASKVSHPPSLPPSLPACHAHPC